MMLQNLLLTGSSAFVTAERTAMHHALPIPSLKNWWIWWESNPLFVCLQSRCLYHTRATDPFKIKKSRRIFLDGLEPKSPLYSRGVLPIELYTLKSGYINYFAVYVFKMAGYSGVEPLRGDRQSPVLTDIRIPRKNQDTCYINFVAIIYKITFIDNRWDRTNKHQRFMFAVRIFKKNQIRLSKINH